MFLLITLLALKDLGSSLKIGVLRKIEGCKKFVEDGNNIYLHLIARVEGREEPVVDTYREGKPWYIKVNNSQYIPGFNLGLRGACEKEIRRITIPPELAYEGESVEGLFGSEATWVVDAEIIEVLKEKTF